MLKNIKRRWRKLVRKWNNFTNFTHLLWLDGVGPFHENEVCRHVLPESLFRFVSVSPNGRYLFLLSSTMLSLSASGETADELIQCTVYVVDLLMDKYYSIEIPDLWHMEESRLLNMYCLSDDLLVLIDQNQADKTLRQRLVKVSHVKRKAFCFFYRGILFEHGMCVIVGVRHCAALSINGQVYLFAKDPKKANVYPISLSRNISPLVVELQNYVHSLDTHDLLCKSSPFFSANDAELCFFLVNTNRGFFSTVGTKMKIACICLNTGATYIRLADSDSRTGFPIRNDNLFNAHLALQSNTNGFQQVMTTRHFSSIPRMLLPTISLAICEFGICCALCIMFRRDVYRHNSTVLSLFTSIPVYFLVESYIDKLLSYVEENVAFIQFIQVGLLDTLMWRWHQLNQDDDDQLHSVISENSNQIITISPTDFYSNIRFPLSCRVSASPIACCSLSNFCAMAAQRYPNTTLRNAAIRTFQNVYDADKRMLNV